MERKEYRKSQGEIKFPHLGGLIQQKMKERRVRNSDMARKMGVTSQTFGAYLKNDSLQFRVLWDAGLALEYNFLADVMSHLPEQVLNSVSSTFQEVILAQAEEIRDLKKEVAILKEVLKG